jgi:hypothetical protein
MARMLDLLWFVQDDGSAQGAVDGSAASRAAEGVGWCKHCFSSADMTRTDSVGVGLAVDGKTRITGTLDFICIAPMVGLDSAPLWRMSRMNWRVPATNIHQIIRF